MNGEIERVSDAYQSWRQRTRRGAHLPPQLKKQIIDLTNQYDIVALSRQLNISPYTLKRWHSGAITSKLGSGNDDAGHFVDLNSEKSPATIDTQTQDATLVLSNNIRLILHGQTVDNLIKFVTMLSRSAHS